MSILNAIILGLVQGLTEFIPVSSSGHLVLAQEFLGVDNFTFSVLLNFGTLLALVVFYRQKIIDILRDIFVKRNTKLAVKLIAATVPAAIFGVVLGGWIESLNDNVPLVIIMLAVVGVAMVLFGAERKGKLLHEVENITWRQAVTVGFAQVAALVPGTSRSGITILAGLQQRLSAKAAAEYSFLLAIPIITGASLKILFSNEGTDFITGNFPAFLAGNLASFVSGYLAVSFLIGLLGRQGLKAFGWYRLALALVLSVLLFAKII